jgi:hypothetical protein
MKRRVHATCICGVRLRILGVNLLAVIALLVAVSVIGWSVEQQGTEATLKKRGVRVPGVIIQRRVDIERAPMPSDSSAPRSFFLKVEFPIGPALRQIEFVVDQETYVTTLADKSINVVYDPAFPEIALLASDVDSRRFSMQSLAFGCLSLVLSFCLFMQAKHMFRQWRGAANA